jgi:hypothetical protein
MLPFDDDLSPEELAYMQSGGRTELPAKPAAEAVEPVPAAPEPAALPDTSAPAVADAPKTEAPAEPDISDDDDEDLEEGQYVKDAQGRLRDPKTNRFVKMVPINAVHRVRDKHKATRAELEKLRIDMARGEERLAILNEAFSGQNKPQTQQQAPKEETEPNPFEEPTVDHMKDFVGAFDQMSRRNAWLLKQREKDAERTANIEQQTSQRDAMSSLRQTYTSDVQAFRQANPDFMDAYQHLVKGRLAELDLQGVRDPLKRKAIIEAEETQIVAQALQNNQSPAQLIYGIAKARGYMGKPATPAPAATPTSTPAPNAATEKIKALQTGQAAAQTLSNVGGQAAPSLTYEALARMNQSDFDAAVDQMTEKQLERFLGGR